ncbi:hypothetical protein M427DRAFT_506660 [Gonapodya prolifera JEL478]|uniref:Uncharacterized protein n=1 Tax=Gonapodya prolifera (strain JEL478) TaxID=1344416 RepID=A0A139ASC1_GONPJ|nr:hypothetical protein M427DRAFT_506660 [Gonapodya prolifera JEL478]|eukprot:KXS19650.1 hypothetical protein M427DRAFT_506660 [Gonapodya prolifera JEL478]
MSLLLGPSLYPLLPDGSLDVELGQVVRYTLKHSHVLDLLRAYFRNSAITCKSNRPFNVVLTDEYGTNFRVRGGHRTIWKRRVLLHAWMDKSTEGPPTDPDSEEDSSNDTDDETANDSVEGAIYTTIERSRRSSSVVPVIGSHAKKVDIKVFTKKIEEVFHVLLRVVIRAAMISGPAAVPLQDFIDHYSKTKKGSNTDVAFLDYLGTLQAFCLRTATSKGLKASGASVKLPKVPTFIQQMEIISPIPPYFYEAIDACEMNRNGNSHKPAPDDGADHVICGCVIGGMELVCNYLKNNQIIKRLLPPGLVVAGSPEALILADAAKAESDFQSLLHLIPSVCATSAIGMDLTANLFRLEQANIKAGLQSQLFVKLLPFFLQERVKAIAFTPPSILPPPPIAPAPSSAATSFTAPFAPYYIAGVSELNLLVFSELYNLRKRYEQENYNLRKSHEHQIEQIKAEHLKQSSNVPCKSIIVTLCGDGVILPTSDQRFEYSKLVRTVLGDDFYVTLNGIQRKGVALDSVVMEQNVKLDEGVKNLITAEAIRVLVGNKEITSKVPLKRSRADESDDDHPRKKAGTTEASPKT